MMGNRIWFSVDCLMSRSVYIQVFSLLELVAFWILRIFDLHLHICRTSTFRSRRVRLSEVAEAQLVRQL